MQPEVGKSYVNIKTKCVREVSEVSRGCVAMRNSGSLYLHKFFDHWRLATDEEIKNFKIKTIKAQIKKLQKELKLLTNPS